MKFRRNLKFFKREETSLERDKVMDILLIAIRNKKKKDLKYKKDVKTILGLTIEKETDIKG